MCFAFFKMNKFEKNPKKYIKEKCSFLLSRGYTLKSYNRNAEFCFNFYIKDEENNDFNHIYFLYENDYVDCTFSNVNTKGEVNCLFRQFPARVLGNCRPLPKRAIANTCRRLEVPYFSFINLIK